MNPWRERIGLAPQGLVVIVLAVKLVNLAAALNQRPFRPFTIRVDGSVIPVRHPEQTLFAEGKTTLVVVDPDDHVHILDVDQISKVQLQPRRATPGNGSSSNEK